MAGQFSVSIPFSCKICRWEASNEQLLSCRHSRGVQYMMRKICMIVLVTFVVKLQRRCFSGAFGRAVQQNAPG